MKPYLFPIRLYPEDHKRRLYLEKTMRDSSGRKMTFAAIIRELMVKEVDAIPVKAMQKLMSLLPQS